ncbi:MAG: RHS repeat-associated core domain-containing protein, partial [Clostridia bacterium]|nr:RHS repeat-associated core domain-containing protein [Clostridia bacterium]
GEVDDVYTYTYDNGGNILSVTLNDEVIKTYTYGDSEWKDLLTNFNGTGFTYDNIGNPLTYRDGMSFTWADGRKLASITKGEENIAYTYDINGLRTSKTVNGITTEYYWLNGMLQGQKTGSEHIIFLYDENGLAYGFLVYENGVASGEYYYIFNAQGDVIGILDSTGTQVVEYNYNVWGELISITGTLADTIGQKNPLRYRGYYFDAETGFYYLQSRYYDPVVQRFINADGLLSTGQGILGYNMFAYCGNNAVNNVDYTGQSWKKVGNLISKAWNGIKSFAKNNFGAGIVQAQEYKALSFKTLIAGIEDGGYSEKVISGDVCKLVSVYVKNASTWWRINEYKVGGQINIAGGGFNYEFNPFEISTTISGKNSSLEFIAGYNKCGYTYKSGVDFQKRTSGAYTHGYIRTFPTAIAVATAIVVWPYAVGALSMVGAINATCTAS